MFCARSVLLVAVLTIAWSTGAVSEDISQCERALEAQRSGNLRGAIEDYSGCIDTGELSPTSLALVYLNRGIAWHHLGETRRAIEDYDRTLTLDSNLADAYFGRGVAWIDLGEPRRAIEDYDQAIALNPDDARFYYNRGNVWIDL